MSTVTNAVETLTLNVTGMTCGSCERHIKKELDQVPGYSDARVNLAAGRVDVSFQAGTTTPDQLIAAVVRAGYPAEVASAATETRPGDSKSCGCCAPRNS